MQDTAASTRWWEAMEPGSYVELGFVHIDRVGSTQDWHGLSGEQVIARRAEFHQLVEAIASGFGAMQPIAWQGDGAMLFVSRTRNGQQQPGAPATQAGLMAVTLHQQFLCSGFNVRLGVHCGRVPFERDSGKLASQEIDRAGHLEHDCPEGAVALSEDIYVSLPQDLREKCAYLGTTLRDGTVAFVYPRAMVSHRDPACFVSPSDDPEPARQRFLEYVHSADIRRLRYVGFRLHRREPPSLDLFDVFTPLDAEEYRPLPLDRDDEAERARRSRRKPALLDGDTPDAPWFRDRGGGATPRAFSDTFRLRRHLVVLGAPGAGKSTLLRWLALIAAGGRTMCRQRLGVDERLLPLLAPVGRLSELRESLTKAGGAGGGPSVLEAMAHYFHERNAAEDVHELTAFLHRRLQAGECLVLLDGLDEVATERRHEVARWTESFAAAYRANRFVVTSRLVGFGALDLPGGLSIIVRPFTDAQVRDYLVAWYRAYRAWEANLTPENAARDQPAADAESGRLLDVLSKDPRLRALARNPFLLSALALVHRAEGQLPAHRVQLYDLFARALCETWDQARKLTVSSAATPSRIEYESEGIPILGLLAFWLHEHHISGVAPESEVKAQIAQALIEEVRAPADEAARAADQFLQRAGRDLQIIAERGAGEYGFLHLTFEEFFAAQYLHAKERFQREAQTRWFDPRWEEVILLGVGTLSVLQKRPVAAAEFIRDILTCEVPGYPFVTDILKKQVILAAKCCADAPNLDPAVRQEVAERFLPLLVGARSGATSAAAHRALARMRGSSFAADLTKGLVTALGEHKDEGVRSRAAEALGQLGESRAVDALLTALREEQDERVRRDAVRALGQLGETRAVDALLTALREEQDEWVRGSAAEALGQGREPRAVDALLAVLRQDQAAGVRRSAAWALGQLGERRAVDALLAALRQDQDEWVRASAAEALGELGEVRAADSLLAVLREEQAESVHERAAVALKRLGEARVADVLLTALREGQPDTARARAAGALGQVGEGEARVMDVLLTALREYRDQTTRANAAWALGCLGEVRAVDALLTALRADDYDRVRVRAAEALGRVGEVRAVEALLAALREDKAQRVRASAAWALGQVGEARAVDALLTALREDQGAGVRASAAVALGEIGETRAVGALLTALREDQAEWVRGRATEALWSLSERLPVAAPTAARKRARAGTTPRKRTAPRTARHGK
jgi:HEAT repeat protein